MEEKLTITTGLALSPQFAQAFSKLLQQDLGISFAYWLRRIVSVLEKTLPDAEKARNAIVAPLQGGQLTDEARNLLVALFDEKLELPLTRKLVLLTDSKANLSAADLIALDPILEVAEPV